MNIHKIKLEKYHPLLCHDSLLTLGTAGSHGNEQLQIILGDGWEDLTIQVIFHPSGVAVQLPPSGLINVPWEATENVLTSLQGRIVFQGFNQDRLVNTTDIIYTVAGHSSTTGRDERPYTPGIVEGVLNQMATDKNDILTAAEQVNDAKTFTATQAIESKQNADLSKQILNQILTESQQAIQQIKTAEDIALNNITTANALLPSISADDARKSIVVKTTGLGYELAELAPISAAICPTAKGNPALCKYSTAWMLQGLKIYGKSIQSAAPCLENPIPIQNTGDSGSLQLEIIGKNLIVPDPTSIGGITCLYEDGVFIVTGSTNTTLRVKLGTCHIFAGQNYVASGGIDSTNKLIISKSSSSFEIEDTGNGKKYTADQNTEMTVYIRVESGQTVNLTIKPQLELGSVCTSYQPYTSQLLTISTPNGLSGIPVKTNGNYTDPYGQEWVCDTIDFETNQKTLQTFLYKKESGMSMKYVESDLKSVNHYCISISNFGKSDAALCNKLPYSYSQDDTPHFYVSQDSIHIFLPVDVNPTEFECNFLYLLSSPIVVPVSCEEIASYRSLVTYNGSSLISTNEPVTAMEVKYIANGTSYLQSVIDRIDALEIMQK